MSAFSKFMKLLSLAGGVRATNDPVTGGITKIWTGTQAQYDAIVTKDDSTLYVIVAG